MVFDDVPDAADIVIEAYGPCAAVADGVSILFVEIADYLRFVCICGIAGWRIYGVGSGEEGRRGRTGAAWERSFRSACAGMGKAERNLVGVVSCDSATADAINAIHAGCRSIGSLPSALHDCLLHGASISLRIDCVAWIQVWTTGSGVVAERPEGLDYPDSERIHFPACTCRRLRTLEVPERDSGRQAARKSIGRRKNPAS